MRVPLFLDDGDVEKNPSGSLELCESLHSSCQIGVAG